ncbi:hypothetical protein [Dongia sedimenti]|uniref:Uncharacterized protein n=1 Tax=Dongia sedimenti TaxID=3064282 RepID=A0ABU0YU89_9PROT|nr:hypothetical protein [Rhodospirillaceae bacterium R-7]
MRTHWAKFPIISAMAVLGLAACKFEGEKQATRQRLDEAGDAIAMAMPKEPLQAAISGISGSAIAEYATACRHQLIVSPGGGCSEPAIAGALGVDALSAPDPAELALWQEVGGSTQIAAQVAARLQGAEQELVRAAVRAHWVWAEKAENVAQILKSALIGAQGESLATAPVRISAFALMDEAKIRSALRYVGGELQILALRPDSAPVAETIESAKRIKSELERALELTPTIGDLRSQIVETADNADFDAALAATPAAVVAAPSLAGLGVAAPIADTPTFFAGAQAFGAARRLVDLPQATDAFPDPLTKEAAQQLIDDCRAVRVFSPSAATELCDDNPALAWAVSQAAKLGLSGVEGLGPSPAADGSGPNGPVESTGVAGSHQAKVRAIAGTLTPEDAAHLQAVARHVGELNVEFAKAAAAGYLEAQLKVEVRLELMSVALRAGSSDPSVAKDPIRWLTKETLSAGLREAQRHQRMLNSVMALADHPDLETTKQAVDARVARFEQALSNHPSAEDLLKLVQSVDPEKTKILLAEQEPQLKKIMARKKELWVGRFGALPQSFTDDYRGPRGPPDDPTKPRSPRALRALMGLGEDADQALRTVSTLRAEYNEFHALLGGDAATAKQWSGLNRFEKWLAANLSDRDLAIAHVRIRRLSSVPSAELAPGWSGLDDAIKVMREALEGEVTERLSHPGGGYPPKYPPGAKAFQELATRYLVERSSWTAAEQAEYLGMAQRWYGDKAAMPAAVESRVREIIDSSLDRDLKRVKTLTVDMFGSDGHGGLLDIAARSTRPLTEAQYAALQKAKDSTGKAAIVLAGRIEFAVAKGLASAQRPDDLDGVKLWIRNLGADPPPTAPPVAPAPDGPVGGGGAGWLFADAGLERSIVETDVALIEARAAFDATAEIRQATVAELPLVGTETGRSALPASSMEPAADGQRWKNGSFDFKSALQHEDQTARYPSRLQDWRGFLNEEGKPFEYKRYVLNFTDFRAVGGGIHLGGVAEPATQADGEKAAGSILRLESDDTLALTTGTGERYVYGPVDPRVLKALYAFVRSDPKSNLGISVGAAGGGQGASVANGFVVLLDPHFVDNPVGQDLYLADAIPWDLDQAKLPNGADNPIALEFGKALAVFHAKDSDISDGIVKLFAGSEDVLTGSDWRKALDGAAPSYGIIALVGSAASDPDLIEKATEARLSTIVEARTPLELDRLRKLRALLSTKGYSAADIREADRILQGGTSLSILSIGGGKQLADAFRRDAGGKEEIHDLALLSDGKELEATKALQRAIRSKYGNDAAHDAEAIVAQYPELAPAARATAVAVDSAILAASVLRPKSGDPFYDINVVRAIARTLLLPTGEAGWKKPSPAGVADRITYWLDASLTLATLMDSEATFHLAEGRIQLANKMIYAYARSAVIPEANGIRIRQTDDAFVAAERDATLGAVATDGFFKLSDSYPPLKRVREYAEIAAFLRWAIYESAKSSKPPVIVDFSRLATVAYRDRSSTPTPDIALHKVANE